MNQAEDEEGLDAAFGGVEALVECLRADVEMVRLVADGAGKLVDGGFSGRNGVQKGKQELLRGKALAGPLDEAGILGEEVGSGAKRGPEMGGEEWHASNIMTLADSFPVKKYAGLSLFLTGFRQVAS